MFRRAAGRAIGIGVLAAALLATQPGAAGAAPTCTWTEYTYKVTFHCDVTTCHGSAKFAYYLQNVVTVHTGNFGGNKTISSDSRYLVKGSESCAAS